MKTDYDVIVCGGGPGGVGAAVGAARTGADVLLVERYGFLGGGATAMLVNPFMTYFAGDRQIIHGVLQEIIEGLLDMGAYGHPKTPWAFDAEAVKIVCEQLCLENGVDLLYHTFLASCAVEDNMITEIQVATKDGIKHFTAKIFIDSTGDGDLAYFSGAPTEKGRQADGLAQPMTLNFRMANVEIASMPPVEEMTERYVAAKTRGEIQCPREDILIFFTTQPDVVHFNQTRVIRHDATDPVSYTKAEVEGRRQAWQISQWLIGNMPGFENAYLQQTAPQLGVRESRRVMGEYILTDTDLLNARKFSDVIVCGSYPVDIHNPDGEGTVLKHLKPGEWYDVPYRALVPLGVDNLLIGSRCISTTHAAHSAIRVMPIVFGIGQAAGIAAGQCALSGVLPRNADAAAIQTELLKQGGSLGDLNPTP
ncbi:MAG: FAD-dependent oxidoreductase [Firmicutes bacterium]|nr:FAD-dependent oxidoreductase [Bacillota bacterium]